MAAPRPPRYDASADEVARVAAAAPDWATLAAAARPCVACPELAAVRQHVVVGDVPEGGRPLFALVGEAPGATEDETGRPFVGRSGALLDQLLGEAGLSRSEAAVLNIVKCRPPGNRTPKAPEVARCSGWLRRQLELLDPPAVVALGLSAAKWFLGPADRPRPRPRAGARTPGTAAASTSPTTRRRPSGSGPNGAPRAALLADLRQLASDAREGRPP